MAFVKIISLAKCHKGGGTFVRHGDLELAVFWLTEPCGTGFQPVDTAPGTDPDVPPSLAPGERIDVAPGLAPGERVVVIDNACPHAGGNLSGGEVTGNAVTCRWHHWTFDLDTGACTDSPRARARVRRYPAQVRDGAVWADLPAC